MNDKKVMQMALDALEDVDGIDTETECVTIDVGEAIEALRTALMQSKLEPVDLQDDEIYDAAFSAYCKGENSRELFRIMWGNRLTCSIGWDREELKSFARNIAALYTAPPQRKPLSDEEIKKLHHIIDWTNAHTYKNFARAIEAAHGIKD